MMNIHSGFFLLALAMLIPAGRAQSSDDEDAEEVGQRCINSRTIRRTEVINDSNILFYTQGGTMYLNSLPGVCKGLARNGRFSFVTYTRSLCRLDRISVLKESGFGLYEGRTCKLGRFEQVTAEDLERLFEHWKVKSESSTVEPPPPEDIGEETED